MADKKTVKKKVVKKTTEGDAPKIAKSKWGKKYTGLVGKVDKSKMYTLDEALALAKETSPTKFDATMESHWALGLDVKQSDQNLRSAVSFPHGLGKTVKILVMTQGEKVKEAETAGADYVGLDDYIAKIKGGWTDFDILIASPDVMAKVGQLGQVLGPKGLMPNPKVGTVNDDVAKAVKDFKAGKYEFKTDKDAMAHIPFGKVSFEIDKLRDNFIEVLRTLKAVKPSASKGQYIKRITIATTMGPGIKIDLSSVEEK